MNMKWPSTKQLVSRRAMMARTALIVAGVLPWAGCADIAGVVTGVAGRDYAVALRGALQPFTDNLAGYHFRATPLGNFGVGSVYLNDVQFADPSAAEGGWFLGGPQSWLAMERPEAERRAWLARLISEGSFGAFHLDGHNQRELAGSLSTAVFVALGGGVAVDYQRGTSLSFQAKEVRNRRLNWAELQAALAANLIGPAVAQAIVRNDFVIAAADIVLMDYRATVAVDESVNPELAASLRIKSMQQSFKERGASVTVSMREETRGRFVASSNQPLVAAVLFKRPPPRTKDLPVPSDLNSWPSVSMAGTALNAVESRVLGLPR